MSLKPPATKSTIKNDPFAAVIPLTVEAKVAPLLDPPSTITPPAQKSVEVKEVIPPPAAKTLLASPLNGNGKSSRQKLTVHLPSELAERVKNAAY